MNPPSDYTLRCRECEARLKGSPIVLSDIPGNMYECSGCGTYWLESLDGKTLSAMEVIK